MTAGYNRGKEGTVYGENVVYLAMSVDGYIAYEQGGVNWLGGDGSPPDDPGSYTPVMGWTTYHQIVTELSLNRGIPAMW